MRRLDLESPLPLDALLPKPFQIDVHLEPDAYRTALIDDVRAGLFAEKKELSPKWFYDELGSVLFEEITRLPEYYPTRREREILTRQARQIALGAQADTLVELGSGTSEKTILILDAMCEAGELHRYCPFDVSETTLREAAMRVARRYREARIHGVVGDFDRHLDRLPRGGRRMIAFLGGTIGNYKPHERERFLTTLAAGMEEGDTLLLGTDLLKDRARLHAAYNDASGVTARFNKNLLSVLNRELGADFDLDAFEHEARFDEENLWIEMVLRSTRAQTVTLSALDAVVRFERGEELRTEISAKFTAAQVKRELESVGLSPVAWWTDRADDFALSLWSK